jgi:hypothetical protein
MNNREQVFNEETSDDFKSEKPFNPFELISKKLGHISSKMSQVILLSN